MPKGRLVFDGDNIYTEKDARIYKLKSSVSSKIDAIPWVVDSLDSTSATDALSANMGRQLQDQINSLSWTWKFLSTWDCTTWLPGTNPQEDPYTYKVWDYYVVSATGSTNYKPHWGTYTQWVPSTTVELENVWTNDKYYFDGADWVRIPDTAIQIWIDTALSTTSTNAVENRAIATAINAKQDTISDLSTIRAWAAAWATALQKLDNISELTNNIWYQTAWDVNSAINSALTNYATKTYVDNAVNSAVDWIMHTWNIAPANPSAWDLWYDTINNVLKIYNWTSWETVDTDTNTTYTAWNWINIDANNEISVDTTVVATKTYVDDALDWMIHEWSSAPSNPQEWDLWYDTVNHVLKIYNWTTWETVDTDSDTKYTAWNGINIDANNEISVDTTIIPTQADLAWKQDVLTAWDNVQISAQNVISATNTTYTAWEWIEIKNWPDYSAMQWPAPDGFHVPASTEWQWLKSIMDWLSLTTWDNWRINLHMPFAGIRNYSNGNVGSQESTAYYWSSSGDTYPRYAWGLTFNSGMVNPRMSGYRAAGQSLRCFKDSYAEPTASWTIVQWTLWSAWIFWNQSEWLISITDWSTGYTIMDKNLWATTVYNDWDTLSEANCGKYYQWGNNYWFPWTGSITTSTTQVDASWYWPTNPYSSDTFIIWNGNWSSVQNDNLWWWETWVVTLDNAISVDADVIKNISVSWASTWTFLRAAQAAWVKHTIDMGTDRTYTFQWVWYILIDNWMGWELVINWIVIFSETHSGWTYEYKHPSSIYTMGPWDIVRMRRPWSRWSRGWEVADFY